MTAPERSIARVVRHDGQPLGLAFVVAERHLLTCAHVVNVALGRAPTEPAPPGAAPVWLEFPFGDDDSAQPVRRAVVSAWLPGYVAFERGDVAGLTISEPLPAGVGPMALADGYDRTDRTVQMWGPVPDRTGGGHVSGRVQGLVSTGRSQINQDTGSPLRVGPGFSGGPVWHPDTGAVVGMVVAAALDARDTDAYMLGVEILVDAWPELLGTPPPCPYPGLRAFGEDDAGLFFGREEFVRTLADAAASQPVVAVMGPSGVGKSSVVDAGLVPELRARQPSAVVRARPGHRALTMLALSFAEAAGGSEPAAETWANRLRRDGLAGSAAALADTVGVSRTVVVLDQFEQILLDGHDPTERADLLRLLADLAAGPVPARLVLALTLRDDYLGPLVVANQDFGDYVRAEVHTLRRMTLGELRRATAEPARLADPPHPVVFQDGLIEQIYDDYQGRPGELPLLQFALSRLWERQRRRTLTHEGYREIGRVTGALTRYADERVDALSPEQQAAAARVFTSLVLPGTRDVSRRVFRHELRAEDWPVVVRLHEDRLVVLGWDATAGEETVEVAHEVLLRGWDRLAGWIAVRRDFLDWQARMAVRLADWEAGTRNPMLLLPAPLLVEAEKMAAEHPHDVAHLREFLDQSRAARDQVPAPPATVVVPPASGTGTPPAAPAPDPVITVQHGGIISLVELSKDGRRALTAAGWIGVSTAERNRTVRVWDTATGAQVAAYVHRSSEPVRGAAFSPDGTRVLSTCGTEVRFWDAATGADLMRGDDSGAGMARWSPDGGLALTARHSNVVVWDATTGDKVVTLRGNSAWQYAHFNPDGRRLIAVVDTAVLILDSMTGAEVTRYRHAAKASLAGFTTDGARAISADSRGTVAVWDAATGSGLLAFPHERTPSHWWHSDERVDELWTVAEGTVRLWDLATGREIHRVTVPAQGTFWFADGPVLMAMNRRVISAFDATTGVELTRHTHTGDLLMVASDGKSVICGGRNQIAHIWTLPPRPSP
jgi:hypothetical protein